MNTQNKVQVMYNILPWEPVKKLKIKYIQKKMFLEKIFLSLNENEMKSYKKKNFYLREKKNLNLQYILKILWKHFVVIEKLFVRLKGVDCFTFFFYFSLKENHHSINHRHKFLN